MSDWLKKNLMIITLFVFTTFITIISPSNDILAVLDEETRYGGYLISSKDSDADLLNPLLSSYLSTSSYIENFLFEGMLTYDRDMQIVPELALEWEISPNKLDYTFYLRQDTYWHDKVPFTADDVIFTLDQMFDSRNRMRWRGLLSDFLDHPNIPYEKLGDYTVVFHLRTSYTPILNRMMFLIIPKHVFEPYCPPKGEGVYEFNDCPPNIAPIGTGPMMFDEWIREDQIELKRNSQANGGSGYWLEHDAYLDGVIVKIIPEVTTQLLALKNGEIDMMDITSTKQLEIEVLQEDPNFVVYTAPQFYSNHIAFNCDPSKGHHEDNRDFIEEPNYFAGFTWMEDDPTKLPGPNIRKALNYAINKDQLIEIAYPYGYRNLGPIYRAQIGWYYEGVERYDYDIEKTNQLLAEAGFGADKDDPLRSNLKFTISYNAGNVLRQKICNYAKGQWESLGLCVSVETVEWFSMLDSHYDHRKFDSISAGQYGGLGGDPYLTHEWHSKSIEIGGRPSSFDLGTYIWEWEGEPIPGGMNYMGYWNPEVDNLLDIAREEPEQFLRKMYYNQIQEMIVDDSPYIWLLSHVNMEAIRSNIHGMIQESVAGLWSQPVGFHNIWKSTSTEETMSTTSGGVANELSSDSKTIIRDDLYTENLLLPVIIIGCFFAIGSALGLLLRKR